MTVSVANTYINNSIDFLRQRLNQLATITTTQTVTVGGNSAVGAADITGSLRTDNLYATTLYGGSIGNNQTLTVVSNVHGTANIALDHNITVGENVSSNNVTVISKVVVGNTLLSTANIYSDAYFGTWTGNTVATLYGGTGSNTTPGNGSILIGDGSKYRNAQITSTIGLSITVGPGTLQIDNIGLTSFRTSTNTANVYTAWRTGNITFTATDVINALGYFPGNANTTGFVGVGTDLNYFTGNVAIGYSDNAPRSYAKLQILQTDTATNLPGVLIENTGNNATSGSYLGLSVANTTSVTGIRFQANRNNSGAIEYKPATGFLSITTANTVRGGFDNAGNIGLGTVTPQPNKGGSGIHVVANNAGFTLDSGSGAQWHIGMNPNMASLGGTRAAGGFGLFSDSSNTGIIFNGSGNTGAVNIITNGLGRVAIDYGTGLVRIATSNAANGAMLQVGGDIVTEGNFANYSDYRLKNNVEELTDNQALDRIIQLRPVSFRWNRDNHLEEGFIAHEVKEVIPTAVKGVKDAFEYQTLDKSQLTPTIVKSIQALINIVNEQQEEINRLKGL